jgi:hypothetical protein
LENPSGWVTAITKTPYVNQTPQPPLTPGPSDILAPGKPPTMPISATPSGTKYGKNPDGSKCCDEVSGTDNNNCCVKASNLVCLPPQVWYCQWNQHGR